MNPEQKAGANQMNTTDTVLWKLVVPIFMSILTFLIGAVWKQVHNKIDKIEKITNEKISKVELGLNSKMSKENCVLERQLMSEKIDNIHTKIDNNITQNTKEHTELRSLFDIVSAKQDKTNEELAEISKCLMLLSENVKCK